MFALRKILKKEKDSHGRFSINKYFDEIHSTQDYSDKLFSDLDINEKIFKQSLINKIIIIFLLLTLLFFVFTNAISPDSGHTLFFSFALVVIIVFLSSKIYNGFFNSKQNFSIKINSDFLEINKEKFYWKDISETGIYIKSKGKLSDYYLIIVFDENNYKKFNVNGFNPFGLNRFCTRFSNYIEYFKNLKRT